MRCSVCFKREPDSRKHDKRHHFTQPVLRDGELDGEWGDVPGVVYEIISRCFAERPVDRPKLTEIVSSLQQVLPCDPKTDEPAKMSTFEVETV